ncbi:hypothetical protein LMH87_000650 [Akanthomyces muscarius]|uniref:Uncharacterized protein n=1 Tax=Akanthomyces muscarius TaxID=2231603 RepID=A0A9W8ULB1_AKAMU|nr:hypothetical protein LMH87_000650 [Akanthomyces muscarius]KAJ4155403.1 hypothetical protein LMH87_000650 [Akanthomyces muscarius]
MQFTSTLLAIATMLAVGDACKLEVAGPAMTVLLPARAAISAPSTAAAATTVATRTAKFPTYKIQPLELTLRPVRNDALTFDPAALRAFFFLFGYLGRRICSDLATGAFLCTLSSIPT